MTDIAIIQEAACQKQRRHFISPPRAFRFSDEKPRRRFISKVREIIADWFHSITVAMMVCALMLFAAMAIVIILYVVLFLVAFIMSILA